MADESVDSFITDLHNHAVFCEYGDLHDQLRNCDRIVVGLQDKLDSDTPPTQMPTYL